MENYDKVELALNHIHNVQRNCERLGLRLIKADVQGGKQLGRELIANGQLHDNSKLRGLEFDHLFHGDPILATAVKHHRSTNSHHPEFWGSIHKMPEIFIAEMVCDMAARGSEFGTSVRDWIKNEATKRYNFSMDDDTGKKITYFLDILTEPF